MFRRGIMFRMREEQCRIIGRDTDITQEDKRLLTVANVRFHLLSLGNHRRENF